MSGAIPLIPYMPWRRGHGFLPFSPLAVSSLFG
jgi:hypothetical protein